VLLACEGVAGVKGWRQRQLAREGEMRQPPVTLDAAKGRREEDADNARVRELGWLVRGVWGGSLKGL